jgi:cysteine-rich repeat protein
VQIGEQCDDDNAVNDDGCTNACTLPACGDGILQAGEACDNGLGNGANAACNPECEPASCGDGYVYAIGGEVCDDGNLANSDACTNACALATCGDAFVHLGVEACDDANANNTDGCIDTCQAASCGDGFVWANHEVCDDGNVQNNDGCESNCSLSVGTKKIVHGVYHTCALTWSGNVKCWGAGQLGALGRGNTNNIGDNELPSSIGFINFGGGVVADIETGGYHTCALMNNGTLRCWGSNAFGQLGYGNTNNIGDNEGPGGTVSVGANIAAFGLGGHHTCVLTDQQTVRCWGDNVSGQLGYGNTNNIGDNELPSSVGTVSVGGPVVALFVGGNNTCVQLDTGDIRCWGANVVGELGLGSIAASMQVIGDNELPSSVGPLSLGNTPVTKVVVAGGHSCVLYVDGTMRCWGRNDSGQLGYGNTINIGDNEVPTSVGLVDVGGWVDDIAVGYQNTCVRMGTDIKCWGYGMEGQNGYVSTEYLGDDELPSSYGPINLGINVTHLVRSANARYHCTMSGTTLRCWGYNPFGSLGYGNTNNIGDDETPASAGNVSY